MLTMMWRKWIIHLLLVGMYMGFPGGSVVKNPPAMQKTQEMQAWSLGQEEPLEEEIATYFSFLAWKFLQTEDCGRLQSMELQRLRHDWVTKHTHIDLNVS